MITQIRGLHHVTSLARDAQTNNDFFTRVLGLRRVKKTVNFDSPDVYHLYYGNEDGAPGTIMTYFPFPMIAPGRPGTGEVGTTAFSIPEGSRAWWRHHLEARNVKGVAEREGLGETRLHFEGPDGDGFALVEQAGDARPPWTEGGIDADHAIRGFHSVALRLRDAVATRELLTFMGYRETAGDGGVQRLSVPDGNGAGVIDLEAMPDTERSREGAGSVHHIAFSVPDRAAQLRVMDALHKSGTATTPVIDRDYFWAIYFRTPGGVLFEIATDEPGFARDEDPAHLGEELRIPAQHAHLRDTIAARLAPLHDRGAAA